MVGRIVLSTRTILAKILIFRIKGVESNAMPHATGYDGTSSLGECKECHCKTGGGNYCYEHAPYTVWPKADGTFIVDRNGRKHVFFDEPPIHPSFERLRTFVEHLWSECHDGGDWNNTEWPGKFDALISEAFMESMTCSACGTVTLIHVRSIDDTFWCERCQRWEACRPAKGM
jgi:hypothetical protein